MGKKSEIVDHEQEPLIPSLQDNNADLEQNMDQVPEKQDCAPQLVPSNSYGSLPHNDPYQHPHHHEHVRRMSCCCTHPNWTKISRTQWTLILLCIFTLLTVSLILIWTLVLVPFLHREAQRSVDNSRIEFTALNATHATQVSIGFDAEMSVLHTGGHKGAVEPSEVVLEYLGSKAGVLRMPAFSIGESSEPFLTRSTLFVEDFPVFNRMMRDTLNTSSVQMRMVGPINVRLFWMRFGLHLDQTVLLRGCDGFGTAVITGFQLDGHVNLERLALGIGAFVQFNLENPSQMSITPAGDLKIHLYLNGIEIGWGVSDNVNLVTGVNHVKANSTIQVNVHDALPVMRMLERQSKGFNTTLVTRFESDCTTIPLYVPIFEGIEVDTILVGKPQ